MGSEYPSGVLDQGSQPPTGRGYMASSSPEDIRVHFSDEVPGRRELDLLTRFVADQGLEAGPKADPKDPQTFYLELGRACALPREELVRRLQMLLSGF
ncbi:MAG: hypothetical protein Q8P27_02270 [Candidatus Peregrinibacteria bacterium]|nr:hypothetical protein [Candidatus Peregrinibacteria bacterium]